MAAARFRTTIWTQLGEAAAGGAGALDDFARAYRPAIVSFVRRKGLSESEAEDVAQEVFLKLISREVLAQGDASKGRFRNYLIGVTLHVLSGWRRGQRAAKRGGEWARVDLEAVPLASEANAFEGPWLEELIKRALGRVERVNSAHDVELLTLAATGKSPVEIAAHLGQEPGTTRVALHRARRRLGEALKEEVSAYCSSQEEYEDELKLFAPYLGK